MKSAGAIPTDVGSLQKRSEVIPARGYETDVCGVEDVASVSFPLRSSEDHCIAPITIAGPRFQFDVEDNPLMADWVSTVALLEAEVQKDPAKFASPFAELAPSGLRFP